MTLWIKSINHSNPLKNDITAEEINPRLQKATDIANRPIKVGMEVWNLIGPIFSLKP